MEDQPERIAPATTSRAGRRFSGDDLTRWAWAEPSVWTNSMLATLNTNSVRAGKWHSLMDQVYRQDNLILAYREVAANKGAPGVDKITIEDFGAGLQRNCNGTSTSWNNTVGTEHMARRRSGASTFRNRARTRHVLWESPQFVIALCKPHYAMCRNRSLNDSSRNTATAFAPTGEAKTRCVAWTRCSGEVTGTPSTWT